MSEKEIKELQLALEAEKAARTEAEKALETEKEAHAKTEKALEAEKAAHAETEKNSAQEFENLKAKLAEKSGDKSKSKEVITVDKKKYAIVIPKFTHKGIAKTAADVKADAELQKELIKIGSGVLKAID